MIELVIVAAVVSGAAAWLLVRGLRAWRRRESAPGCSGCGMARKSCGEKNRNFF